ncbi:5-dehydro-4-deoxy-D-glucuronate isomerase [Kutzneria kofuensis]|uniref:4-deoxy-L-threo-5-hexosulose-uronate ketol-isomerase n=1 Tax=Kutzneria kofuensis TaxID=103725 RepID=A0A7W9KGU5_9PSEU|nr:5-dehydro-4-deoxy-D-glucuronate isomerase [Kutzneria kofuensis]MBB5892321.1 4-deoxy-L-threo-5-hexosulose-uronate ketol-isomerase [Kutzneria kofuensis]
MEVRHHTNPAQLRGFDTAQLRENYLVEDLFRTGEVRTVLTHADRVVLGGAAPVPGQPLALPNPEQLRSTSFLERREMAVVVVSGAGSVVVDGDKHELGHRDCLYIGRGAVDVQFHAGDTETHFYLFSATSHASYPTAVARFDEVEFAQLGEQAGANVRELRKYIHADGIKSSQIVVGVTKLADGSVWNTMPPHTHDRRTECYLYFDLPAEDRIVHLCGEPQETRNIIVANEQAVVSPSWSIHSGAGTHSYAFVWAMAGENQAFTDMDQVAVTELR